MRIHSLEAITINLNNKPNGVSIQWSNTESQAKATVGSLDSLKDLLTSPTLFFQKQMGEDRIEIKGAIKSFKVKGDFSDDDCKKLAEITSSFVKDGGPLKKMVFKQCNLKNEKVIKDMAIEANIKLKLREQKDDQEIAQ